MSLVHDFKNLAPTAKIAFLATIIGIPGAIAGGIAAFKSPEPPAVATPSIPEMPADEAARTLRVAINSMRSIAKDRIPIAPPYPDKWNMAEELLDQGERSYNSGDYDRALQSYDSSFDLYSELVVDLRQ